MVHLLSDSGPGDIPGFRLTGLQSWITRPAEIENGFARIKPCLLIRLTAADGTIGWGEAYVLPCREAAVARIIHELGRELSALARPDPWHFRDLATRVSLRHHSMDFAAATSALDIALWDLIGRLVAKPLVELLGRPKCRDAAVYANIWSESNWSGTALVARAEHLIAAGYRAIKLHPMLNHNASQAIEAVRRVRGAIGADHRLMVDMDSETDTGISRAVAKGILPAAPYWFEEPADGADVAVLAELRRVVGIPLVTGERQSGVAHFRTVLALGAVDILNPDIAGVGGLLDMVEISVLAGRHGVRMSPHCWNSMTVAASAMMHVCAAIANAEMAEIYPEYLEHGELYAVNGFTVKNSVATLNGRPGLGVEINEAALSALSMQHYSSDFSAAHAAS
jgi:galactonate dehydratase